MAREEIVAGLKNAVARGESLERAMQTMISAGYSPEEIREAAGYVSMGAIGNIGVVEKAEKPALSPAMPSAKAEEKPKKKRKTWLIVLIIVLIILVGGLLLFALMGEKILNLLFSA